MMAKQVKKAASFRGQRFEGIQVLRGVGALLIFTRHLPMVRNVGWNTHLGIDLFFVISGFIIMYTTQKGVENFGRKRIVKIIPLYWLLTIATFCASYIVDGITEYVPTVSELIKSLFFIPYAREAIDADSAVRPIIGPAHTLLYEVLFYLVFYISARIAHKRRGEITCLILLTIMAAGRISDFGGNEVLQKYTNGRYMDFIFGILMFYILQWIFLNTDLLDRMKKYSPLLIMISGLVICAMVFADIDQLTVSFLALLAVFGFTAAFYGRKGPRLLTFLGDMSYSFYLVHYYVILVMSKLIDPMTVWTVKSVACAGVALLLSIPAAYCSYRVIEIKLADYLLKKTGHRFNRWPGRYP